MTQRSKKRGARVFSHILVYYCLFLLFSHRLSLYHEHRNERTLTRLISLALMQIAGLFHSRFVDSEGKENSGAVSSARNAGFRRIFKVTSFLYSSIRRVHRKSPQLMVKNILSEKRTSLGAKIKYHAYAVTISYKQFCWSWIFSKCLAGSMLTHSDSPDLYFWCQLSSANHWIKFHQLSLTFH